MSTSLLYHAWSLRDYRHQAVAFEPGAIRFRVEEHPATFRCDCCGSPKVVKAGVVPRQFRGLPIGGKAVWIELPVQRLWCTNCRKTRQARVRFAAARCHYTPSFERYVLDLSRRMTIKDVARHLGVSWETVKDIQKKNLHRRFRKPRLKPLRRIAIDEISIGHGSRYLTVVLDLDRGAVVFVGEGKGAEALLPFWPRLRGAHVRIKAVATDLSLADIAAVHKHLPKAIHVFDRFHVVKLFNEKLALFRQELQREVEGPLAKKVLKGTRWLLLKNPENLDEERQEHQRLEEALRLNAPLATVYYMKEDLRQIWEQPDKATAARFLDDWMARARSSPAH